MPARAEGVTAEIVKGAPPGRYYDGDGLQLFVRGPETAFWVYRYRHEGRGREMGLGRARGRNAVSLAEARRAAAIARGKVLAGVDPLAERRPAKVKPEPAAVIAATFENMTTRYLNAHAARWRGNASFQQWRSSLTRYALPRLGPLPVNVIGTDDVVAVLEPIWSDVPETASRLRHRIQAILDFATALGHRYGPNPARWKGHLENVLPSPAKLATVAHRESLPWRELPAFMAELRGVDLVAARAVEFLILTAARLNEVRGMRWREIVGGRVWEAPGERMKAGKPHRVPLSDAAHALLVAQHDPAAGDDALVWRGGSLDGSMPGAKLLRVVRSLRPGLSLHGFRATFRTWAAEAAAVPDPIAEAALAHTVGKITRAYLRSDWLDERRELMERWAVFCGSGDAD